MQAWVRAAAPRKWMLCWAPWLVVEVVVAVVELQLRLALALAQALVLALVLPHQQLLPRHQQLLSPRNPP